MTWFASVKAEIDALPREGGWLDGDSPVTDKARFVAAVWAYAMDERFGGVLAQYGAGQAPSVVPAEDGGLSLQWSWPVGQHWFILFEVGPDGSVGMHENTRFGSFDEHRAPSVEQVVLFMCRSGEAARLVHAYGHDGSVSRPPGEPPDA